MDKNDSASGTNVDEIDLLDIFRSMGRSIAKGIKASGKGILISIVFLFRFWLPLLLSVILGIGASYLFKYLTPPSYHSDVVLRSNAGFSSDIISHVNKLHKYCKDKNLQKISEAVTPVKDILYDIKDIEAFWVIDNSNDGIPDEVDYKRKHNVYDTINVRMQDRLDIRIKIRDPKYLTQIRDGLISYINSDSLFSQRNILRLRQSREMLKRIDYDISLLDSLQKVKYFEETRNIQPREGGQMIFLQEHNTQLVYDEIYLLYQRKQALESELDLHQETTTILSDISIPSRRINGGKYFAIRLVPIIFTLTLLILILYTNRKKISGVFEKYK